MNIEKILINISFIFRPHYWWMNDPYCEQWDKKFLELIQENEFEDIKQHTAKLGNSLVWITNRPHACFSPYQTFRLGIRPSRYAIYKGLKKLRKQERELKRNRIETIINKY